MASLGFAALLSRQLTTGAQGQQKIPVPKWLNDNGQEVFNDIESEENYFGDLACENREKLLKLMSLAAAKAGKDGPEHRARVLLGLALCEYRKGNFPVSLKRFESTISELNMPSEDAMMQNPGTAPMGLMKQAAAAMTKMEVYQAGTALRRAAEIMDRNVRKTLKSIHKQFAQQGKAPPIESWYEELPEHGKSGQVLPMVLQQVPALKQEFGWAEIVDNALDALDKRIAGVDASQKPKRIRLDLGKGKSKDGSLHYARALGMGPYVIHESSQAALDLVSTGTVKAFVSESESLAKSATLLKRSKEGSGCKTMSTTCEKLQKVADAKSNCFGDTRIVVAGKDKGKAVFLDTCNTNANIGILVASQAGVRVTVKGEEPTDLMPKVPLVFDFCREASLEAESASPVLFVQAWHPEFAAVERTTEVRVRAKAFGLSDTDVKEVTKVINDNAKKSWDKSAKLWRKDSGSYGAVSKALQEEVTAKNKKEEEAAEAKRKEDEGNDEGRKAALEELEKKRKAKRDKSEEAERKRLERKKKLEEEKMKRDPWLKVPEVVKAEELIEDLKAQRRDANAKLEFDLSTSLTKDISKAERDVKKIIKKAKKEYKKSQKAGNAGTPEKAVKEPAEQEPAAKGDTGGELAALKAELAEVHEKKKKAAEADNFKEAKVLKKKEEELKAKIASQEL